MARNEGVLQRDIVKALRAEGAFARKVHGGPYVQGMPDVVACYRGWFVGLEVKMPERKGATKLQKDTIKQILEAGGYAGVVRSVEEALAVLKEIDEDLAP